MDSKQLDAIFSDSQLTHEIERRLVSHPISSGSFSEGIQPDEYPTARRPPAQTLRQSVSMDRALEAIVLRYGRPSLLIKDGTFEVPDADTWKARLYPTKTFLDNAIASVGRVELINHEMDWAGTAWVIAEGVVITNRHVADLFAERGNGAFVFSRNPDGMQFGAKIDFKEEHLRSSAFEIAIQDIIYLAGKGEGIPDLAFLRLDNAASQVLPRAIPLMRDPPRPRQTVAVIGYPAFDSRNDYVDVSRIFQDIYNVKRFAPGEIRSVGDDSFTHDCSTLGGNSGSVVIDVRTGAAVGLHFAGRYLENNYAIPVTLLRQYLDDKVRIETVVLGPAALPAEAPQPTMEQLHDRIGYDSGFLGEDDNDVPLPQLSDSQIASAARLTGREAEYIIPYTHYSVVMNGERRMAFFTATNIDGENIKRIKRKADRWFYDPRIDKSHQVGNELYAGNDLDRGHLTRRLDPAWGQESIRGESDTFFFTNCTPQHHLFNTKTWLSLEDYLLESSETEGFRMNVFTGPVFSDRDRPYRFDIQGGKTEEILIPLEYWKVVSIINAETGKLSATAYLLSQRDLISNIEFVFGQFKTYQVPISKVEDLTGLDFGKLREYDPLGQVEGIAIREITSPTQFVL